MSLLSPRDRRDTCAEDQLPREINGLTQNRLGRDAGKSSLSAA